MNILVASEYAGFLGGVEQNIAYTARALRQRGHHLALAYQKTTSQRSQEFLQLFDEHQQVGQNLSTADWKRVPQLVYLHRWPSVEPWLQVCRSSGWPLLRMVHDHDLTCPRRHKYFAWNSRACSLPAGWHCWLDLAFLQSGPRLRPLAPFFRELQLHHQVDRILVASQSMLAELLSNGLASSKLRLIPPCVPGVDQTPGEPSAELDSPELLYVGQLIKGKGVDLLIRALAEVCLKRPQTRLRLVGQGNAQAGLEKLVRRLGLRNQVEFAGFLSPAKIQSAYAGCQFLVVPSRWPEPFGMIGLEAAHHAKAVVAFAVGGIPDWLCHAETGLLVADQDVSGLFRAILHLLENPQWCDQLGQQARLRMQREFSFERYLERLEQVFQDLLLESAKGRRL